MADLAEITKRQQATWSTGDYAVVSSTVRALGDVLCDAVDLTPGATVLDVACGDGNTTLAAARRFARVTGIDYVPALLERARRRAGIEGVEAEFREGDAQALPLADASFDYVLSSIGAMFAPDQAKTASELVRVCKPGGTIGLLNWTPDGFLGDLFKVIASHVPPPPGLTPAPQWGSEDRARALLEPNVTSLKFQTGAHTFRFRSIDEYVDIMRTYYGPLSKAFDALDDSGKRALAEDIGSLVARYNRRRDGTAVWDAGFLVVIATK